MLVEWFIEFGLTVMETLLTPLAALPLLELTTDPGNNGGFTSSFVVPLPFFNGDQLDALEYWFATSVVIALALAAGRVIQWVYSIIPMKAT
jgi:hypothetical protein